MMRILILWSRISGYMAACWRDLALQPGVQLRVLAWDVELQRDSTGFGSSETSGLDALLLDAQQRTDPKIIQREIDRFQPHAILVAGWLSPAYRKAIASIRSGGPLVVMGMDTPWKGFLRHSVTRFSHCGYLSKIDHVLVAGERSWQHARRLGFAEDQITRGLYAWDAQLARACEAAPDSHSWLFVGRYAPEKGFRVLLEAYQMYRSSVDVPWKLVCCGSGALKPLMAGQPGVTDHGFVAPSDLPGIFAKASVFVLPSLYEPWGVALAEAMGCGLPAIATQSVGAAIDLIRDPWNGRLIATGSVEHLAKAMMDLHHRHDELHVMGKNAAAAAEPYQSHIWAQRILSIISR